MKLLNLSDDELRIIYNALYYFSVNADYQDFEDISHLSDDNIDEYSISLRCFIDDILRKRSYQGEK